MADIQLFPEINQVFADNLDTYGKFFMPIATIDLASVNASWKGKIHAVYFANCPQSKVSYKSYNDHVDEYMVSFDIRNDKYSIKTSFDYFDCSESSLDMLEGAMEFYEKKKEKNAKKAIDPTKLLKNLGGKPKWTEDDSTPVNEEGEDLAFICQIAASQIDGISDIIIYLFYDAKNHRAVQMYEFD
jgi:hypothetical protein